MKNIDGLDLINELIDNFRDLDGLDIFYSLLQIRSDYSRLSNELEECQSKLMKL